MFDPRRTETARLADTHFAVRPGTDALVLAWLIRELLIDGADRAELDAHTDPHDIATLRDALDPFTLDVVAAMSGIAAERARRIADRDPRVGQGGLHARHGGHLRS